MNTLRLHLLVLVSILALVAAGCGKDEPPAESPKPTVEKPPEPEPEPEPEPTGEGDAEATAKDGEAAGDAGDAGDVDGGPADVAPEVEEEPSVEGWPILEPEGDAATAPLPAAPVVLVTKKRIIFRVFEAEPVPPMELKNFLLRSAALSHSSPPGAAVYGINLPGLGATEPTLRELAINVWASADKVALRVESDKLPRDVKENLNARPALYLLRGLFRHTDMSVNRGVVKPLFNAARIAVTSGEGAACDANLFFDWRLPFPTVFQIVATMKEAGCPDIHFQHQKAPDPNAKEFDQMAKDLYDLPQLYTVAAALKKQHPRLTKARIFALDHIQWGDIAAIMEALSIQLPLPAYAELHDYLEAREKALSKEKPPPPMFPEIELLESDPAEDE